MFVYEIIVINFWSICCKVFIIMKENVLFLYNVINDKYIKFSFYKLL